MSEEVQAATAVFVSRKDVLDAVRQVIANDLGLHRSEVRKTIDTWIKEEITRLIGAFDANTIIAKAVRDKLDTTQGRSYGRDDTFDKLIRNVIHEKVGELVQPMIGQVILEAIQGKMKP